MALGPLPVSRPAFCEDQPMNWVSCLWGVGSSFLVGFSKTGLPGVSLPAILMMTEAFPEDAKLAVGAILPVLLVGDVFAVTWYRHHAQWKYLVSLFPYVAVGMVPGGVVLWLAKSNELRPVIGVLVLLLLALEFARRWYDWEEVPNQWWFVGLMGLLAGFATIIAHAAFPVMTIYLLSRGAAKREFIGTAAWFFLILNLSKIPIYLFLGGMITQTTVRFDLLVAPVAVAGGVVGVYFLSRIPQKLFDVLALTLAGAAAVRLILV